MKQKIPKPIEDRLILYPSDSSMRGMIFIPENCKGTATACVVAERGPDVPPQIKIGDIVLCEVGFGSRFEAIMPGSKMFWARMGNVYGLFRHRTIYPIGRTVLIKRDVEDKQEGTIVIPENRRTQSLEGTVIRLGLTRLHSKVNDIKPGDRIRLTEWREHMRECQLEDGSFGLIVNESDILYRYED